MSTKDARRKKTTPLNPPPTVRVGDWVRVTTKGKGLRFRVVPEVGKGAKTLMTGYEDSFEHFRWFSKLQVWKNHYDDVATAAPEIMEVYEFLRPLSDGGEVHVHAGICDASSSSMETDAPVFLTADWSRVEGMLGDIRSHYGEEYAHHEFPHLWKRVLETFKEKWDDGAIPQIVKYPRYSCVRSVGWYTMAETSVLHSRVWAREEDLKGLPNGEAFDIVEHTSGDLQGECTVVATMPVHVEEASPEEGRPKLLIYCPEVLMFLALQEGGFLDFVGIGWEDTHTACVICDVACQTEPDFHGWKPHYATWDEGAACLHCIRENEAEFLEYLQERADEEEGMRPIALPWFCGAPEGWFLIPRDLDSGWYQSNRCDNPADISRALYLRGYRSLFQETNRGQFEVGFQVYVQRIEEATVLQDHVLESLAKDIDGMSDQGSLGSRRGETLKKAAMSSPTQRKQDGAD